MSQKEVPVFPVADWTIGPVLRLNIVLMRLGFISPALPDPEEADPGRTYALTPVQARELVAELQRSLRQLGSDA